MIQFAQPWGLLALLSIPAILLLYSLRPRRETRLVSTNSLWREAFRERQRGLGLQKLLRDLSLLLVLLFALALSLALAGPGWSTDATVRDDVVLILDTSASMKARRPHGLVASTRFAEAKRQAADVIDDLAEEGRLLLMTSGRNAVMRTAFESDRSMLQSALERIEPTDETGNPRRALALALSLLRNREHGRVYFVTDAAFDDDVDLDTSRIEFRRVDGPYRNVAITRFDFRPEVGSEERYQVLLAARNYTDEPINAAISVQLGEQPLLHQTLALSPREKKTLVLPVQGRIAGLARATVEYEDDLPQDNEAFAVVEGGVPLHLLLVSQGNFYLESVFEALPNVTLTRTKTIGENFVSLTARHDVVVIDRIPAPELPPGRYLLIDVAAPGLPFVANDRIAQPRIDGRSASAMLRDIDLAGVRIDRTRRVLHTEESSGLQRLFWSKRTDLALALIEDDLRIVFLGFDLADSSFPLQASFPLFLAQSLAWLHPRVDRYARAQVAAGEPVTIVTPNRGSSLVVQTPSGQSLSYELEEGGTQFEATAQAGFYRYAAGDAAHYFAVNLTDEGESHIRPRAVLPDVSESDSPARAEGRAIVALWPHLVLFAIVLLALEWCLWCWRGVSA
ncbi:MAG: VWA domain-containing protein [Gammaproteobacteria bacterium]